MSLQITETSKGFEVRIIPYNEGLKDAIKGIKNSWWWSQCKTWVVPKYQQDALERVKKQLGIMNEPVIEMAEQFGLIPPHPELEIDLKLKRPLLKFQEPGVSIGVQWKKFICGDDMGLGKSSTAIAVSKALNSQCILVICPNVAKYTWQNEWMIADGQKSMVISDSPISSWPLYYKDGHIKVFIINYESLKKYFVKPGWKKPPGAFRLSAIPFRENISLFDCVIVDESHNISNETTLQSRFVRGICKDKPTVILLTGTILTNKVKDIANQLLVIDKLKEVVAHIPQPRDRQTGALIDYSGWNRFLNRYCNGGNGESNLTELQYRLRMICYFRRQKSEVLKDLPDKIRNVMYVDISNREEYVKYEKEFIAYLKEIKASDNPNKKRLLAGQMLVKLGALRNIAARGKVEAAKEYAEQLTRAGKKVVIFAHHQAVITELKKTFPRSCSVTGEDSNEHRQRSIQAFQNNPAVVEIVCSLKVAGENITLTASSDVILVEQPYTNAKLEQAIDRIHRIGQLNKVMAGILLGRKTVDVYVYHNIILKKRDLSLAVTGDHSHGLDQAVDDMLEYFSKMDK